MKRLCLLMLVAATLWVSPVLGDATSYNIKQRPTERWFSGSIFDPAWGWMKAIDSRVEGGIDNPGTGVTFYVDSGVSSEGDGTSWTNAKDTLAEAVALCTASRGDRIKIAQGHAEAIANAVGCVVNVAGVTIEGIGSGSLIPTFTLGTDANATISVTAANVSISNIKVISGLADVDVGITLGALADGAVITNCLFTDGANNKELLVNLSVTADCDNIIIANNRFTALATANTTNAILLAGGSDNSVIAGNFIYGTYTTGGVLASAAASVNLTVVDNVIGCIDAIAYDSHSSTTGLFARNLLGANATSIAAALTGTEAMFCWENYVTGALNASGIIIPAVDSDGG